jgi:hypothetical protein
LEHRLGVQVCSRTGRRAIVSSIRDPGRIVSQWHASD